MEEFHQRLATVGLGASEHDYGFALAGGQAVVAHGFLDRWSNDIDLFGALGTDLKAATDAVVAAYLTDGLTVDVEQRTEYYVRLQVADPKSGDESKVELVLDIRLNPVVRLTVGIVLVAVLHPDDIAGGKIGALFDRAECRDFIDVDALLGSGKYTRERLLEMAAERDVGFDSGVFADMLRTVHRFDDDEFARYGVDPGKAAEIKGLADEWRDVLLPPG